MNYIRNCTSWSLAKGAFMSLILICSLNFTIQAQSGKKRDDAFLKLNNFFRKSYANTRQQVIEKYSPVIAYVDGGLLFIRKGQKPRWENITPALYTELKTVSHVPLALFVMLGLEKEGRLSAMKLKELKDYFILLNAAYKTVKGRSFTNKQQEKEQFTQLDLAIDLVNKCLRTNKLIHEDLKVFLQKSRPLLEKNVLGATAAQIDAAHKYTKEFYQQLSDEEKKKLMVLVSGPKAARKEHAITQYFAKVLNVKGEGARILYMESVFSRKGLMRNFGTFMLDSKAGEAFFDDRWRVQRDLLSDAAKYYLSTMSFSEFR